MQRLLSVKNIGFAKFLTPWLVYLRYLYKNYMK